MKYVGNAWIPVSAVFSSMSGTISGWRKKLIPPRHLSQALVLALSLTLFPMFVGCETLVRVKLENDTASDISIGVNDDPASQTVVPEGGSLTFGPRINKELHSITLTLASGEVLIIKFPGGIGNDVELSVTD